jgi:hypothetical protein
LWRFALLIFFITISTLDEIKCDKFLKQISEAAGTPVKDSVAIGHSESKKGTVHKMAAFSRLILGSISLFYF